MNSTPSWLHRQYGRGRRILAGLAGRRPTRDAHDGVKPAEAGTTEYRSRVEQGEASASAALAAARECLATDNLAGALRLGHQLAGQPETEQVGRAVLGLCRLHTSGPEQAWHSFAAVDEPALVAAAAPEYFQAGFVADPATADLRAGALADLDPGDRPSPGAVLKVAQTAFSVDRLDLAAQLVAAAEAGAFGTPTDNQAYQLQRLATWLPGGLQRRAPELPAADLRFGVIGYKQPDNSSRNVGDFIQTLASLGHLVRHDNLRFVGDPDLVEFADSLRATVKPERRLDDASATVHLLEVHRDGNVYQELPEPTWAVMFGWYLHPTFAGGYNLPFHPSLRPLFISFHLNKPDALTPAAVDYLRRYGPVGCRDWQTVALLTAAGIPAFFSGCITTTVDTVFARTGADTRTATGYVDAREGTEEDDNIEQSVGDIRRDPLSKNLALAYEWVRRYHEDYRRVVTSRLHSYLPARSVGCTVEFDPANRSDPRFGGLIDIDDAAYERIRQGILAKLAVMIDLLASGAGEDEARARWRDLCAEDVAAATAHLDSLRIVERPLPDLSSDLPDADRVVLVDAARNQPVVARLVGLLDRWAPGIPVVAVGAAATGLPPSVRCLTELPVAEAGSEERRHDLLVAAVLASLATGSRVLVLPADALVRGSVDALFAAPGDAAIAAREDIRRGRRNLAVLLRRISARQGNDWRGALDVLAVGHRLIGHGRIAFDPRVAVVRTDALRAAGWLRLARPLIEDYRATWAEALNVVLAGANRPLDAQLAGNVATEDVDPAAPVLAGLTQSRLSPTLFINR